MAIFMTADLHLGHGNIIKHCARPFADADEMDEALVANWNAVVTRADTVWVLGDFAFRGHPAKDYLKRLNGQKVLIRGNHDDRKETDGWHAVHDFGYETKWDGKRVVLCHYGLRTWNAAWHGSLHFFGHSHGRLQGFRNEGGGGCCDVGVDAWNFAPVRFAEAAAHIETLPERPLEG